ncbi:MAG: hypothetical protein AAGE01_16750 [Pseudomonadota bacterium]
MHTDIEQRLRTDATDIRGEAPQRVRHAVLDAIRNEAPERATGPGWRWPAFGVAAAFAVAVAIGFSQQSTPTVDATPTPVVAAEAVEAAPVAEVARGSVDAMLLAREAALEAEMQRVRRDLERIRGLVENA